MRGNKITAGMWKRKTKTGYTRGKRISVRSRRRAYLRMLANNLTAELRAGAESLTERPTVRDI